MSRIVLGASRARARRSNQEQPFQRSNLALRAAIDLFPGP